MHSPSQALLLAALTLLGTPLAAQCAPQWQPGPSCLGLVGGGVARSTMWDPDGPGPATPVVLFAGDFTIAGNVPARGLATYDPATGTWAEVGGGAGSYRVFHCVLPMPNGDLLVGGRNLTLGGTSYGGLARWDGTTWSSIGGAYQGTSSSQSVHTLVRMPNGDVIAGSTYAANPAPLARWNGTTWTQLATLNPGAAIQAATLMANGDLLVAGDFQTIAGLGAALAARWNGTTWSGVGTVPALNSTEANTALVTRPNGDVLLCRTYSAHLYDGTAWTTLATWNGRFMSAMPMPNGDTLLVGQWYDQATSASFAGATWDGVALQAWGPEIGAAETAAAAMFLGNGDLVLAGRFAAVDDVLVQNAARWNGTTWTPLGAGTDGVVHDLAELSTGELVAAGDFGRIAGSAAPRVAVLAGGSFVALPGAPDGPVTNVAVLPGDSIVAAGDFQQAGGYLARRIARWNGSAWLPLGSGCNAVINDLAVVGAGRLVATGDFTTAGGLPCSYLASWENGVWSQLGGGLALRGRALDVLPNGDLIVGGDFTAAGGVPVHHIARWDGAGWSPIGNGLMSEVVAVAHGPGGALYAAATEYGGQHSVWRYDGQSWTKLGGTYDNFDGPVRALAVTPSGGLYVFGEFTSLGNNAALWTGSAWSDVGFDGAVHCAMLDASDTLRVGGAFDSVAGVVTSHLGRLTASCPTFVGQVGAGCPGSIGTPFLSAITDPWLGSALILQVDNLAAQALPVAIIGFGQQNVPLSTLHPLAPAGCTLHVTNLAAFPVLPANGRARWQLQLPNDPTLVGLSLFEQAAVGEFVGGALTTVVASNALQLTLGMF